MVLNQLTGNLDKIRKRVRTTYNQEAAITFWKLVAWEPTFFKDLIRGFGPVTARDDWVLVFMLSEYSLNFLYFQLTSLSKQTPFITA